MNNLHRDEIKVLLTYLDHDTIRSLASFLMHQYPKHAYLVLDSAMDLVMDERREIEAGIEEIARKLTDIENLAGQLSVMDDVDDVDEERQRSIDESEE